MLADKRNRCNEDANRSRRAVCSLGDEEGAANQIVGLLDSIAWAVDEPSITLSDGVQISALRGTKAESLYYRLCREGLEEGDPLPYNAYLQVDGWDLDCQDEYSIVMRACNLLTIILGTPIGQCRVISSASGLDSASWTRLAFGYGAQKDFIMQPGCVEFTNDDANLLRSAWATHTSFWDRSKANGRLTRALASFSAAWRAHYVDQMIVHLGTALVTLFGPRGLDGLSPLNRKSSGLDGPSPNILAKLMQVREVLLDGECPEEDETIGLIEDAFPLTARIFKTIVTTPALAGQADEGALLGTHWTDVQHVQHVAT